MFISNTAEAFVSLGKARHFMFDECVEGDTTEHNIKATFNMNICRGLME